VERVILPTSAVQKLNFLLLNGLFSLNFLPLLNGGAVVGLLEPLVLIMVKEVGLENSVGLILGRSVFEEIHRKILSPSDDMWRSFLISKCKF
jgi:hypothetical protein